MRASLEKPTERIAKLPIDERGFPVPWFVEWIDGKPEFRAMDPRKWTSAVANSLCWVCGEKMGAYKAFVIGPMCGINRTTAEPPTHLDCAQWSARNCPFLSNPSMVRREDELINDKTTSAAGHMIKRNPGVTLIWITKNFRIFDDGNGRPLIKIGDPLSIEWYTKGKKATYEEVKSSVDTGCPLLLKMAEEDGPEAVNMLNAAKLKLEKLYPPTELLRV